MVCLRLFFEKGRNHAKRKADVRFRWKTTMVNGDNKSSLPNIPFVSRCPWCVSVLAAVCLLAACFWAESLETSASSGSPSLKGGLPMVCVDPQNEETPQPPDRPQNTLHQPERFRQAMPHRLSESLREQGEALFRALPAGRWTPGNARAETNHRSTRGTENRSRRVLAGRRSAQGDGGDCSVTGGRFPHVACFS